MINLIIGLAIGLIISFIFWGWIYHQHKKAWQQEYRRLMGGIKIAISDLYSMSALKNKMVKQPKASDIRKKLQRLYNGE
jgi:hypothetical protein